MNITRKTLSACLIVKNESKWISSCIAHLKHHVDEIIVYDTGSTDNTRELAKDAGACVIEGQWKNDFSWARNQSMKNAKSDWILIIDADELIAESDWNKIHEILARDQLPNLISLTQTTYTNEVTSNYWHINDLDVPEAVGFTGYIESELCRIVRNNSGCEFKGRVHEHLFDSSNNSQTYKSGVRIHHYGMQSMTAEKESEKYSLYLKLGHDKIIEDPDNAHAHYELAAQYEKIDNLAQAQKYYEKACELNPASPLYLKMYAQILHRNRQYVESISAYTQLINLEPDNGDYYVMASSVLIDIGQFDLADRLLIQGDNGNVMYKHNYFNNMGVIQLNYGNIEVAKQCFEKSIGIIPNYKEGLQNLILTCLLSSDLASARIHMGNYPDKYANDISFIGIRAEYNYQIGEYAKAYEDYSILNAHQPGQLKYIYALLVCSDILGKKNETRDYYSRLVTLSHELSSYDVIIKWVMYLKKKNRMDEAHSVMQSFPNIEETAW